MTYHQENHYLLKIQMINWFEMLCLGSNLCCQKIKWVVCEEAIHWEYVRYVEIDLHEWDLKASQRV